MPDPIPQGEDEPATAETAETGFSQLTLFE